MTADTTPPADAARTRDPIEALRAIVCTATLDGHYRVPAELIVDVLAYVGHVEEDVDRAARLAGIVGAQFDREITSLAELLGMPPEVDRTGEDVADAIVALQRERDTLRAEVERLRAIERFLTEANRQLHVAARAIGEGARSGYIPRAWEGEH